MAQKQLIQVQKAQPLVIGTNLWLGFHHDDLLFLLLVLFNHRGDCFPDSGSSALLVPSVDLSLSRSLYLFGGIIPPVLADARGQGFAKRKYASI